LTIPRERKKEPHEAALRVNREASTDWMGSSREMTGEPVNIVNATGKRLTKT